MAANTKTSNAKTSNANAKVKESIPAPSIGSNRNDLKNIIHAVMAHTDTGAGGSAQIKAVIFLYNDPRFRQSEMQNIRDYLSGKMDGKAKTEYMSRLIIANTGGNESEFRKLMEEQKTIAEKKKAAKNKPNIIAQLDIQAGENKAKMDAAKAFMRRVLVSVAGLDKLGAKDVKMEKKGLKFTAKDKDGKLETPIVSGNGMEKIAKEAVGLVSGGNSKRGSQRQEQARPLNMHELITETTKRLMTMETPKDGGKPLPQELKNDLQILALHVLEHLDAKTVESVMADLKSA